MMADCLKSMQPNPFWLRPLRPDDLAAMYELDQICFRQGISYSRVELRRLTERPGSLTLIAEAEKSQLAGFCIAERRWRGGVKAGSILTLDVRPEWRRMGVGSLLMRAQEQDLLSHGVSQCTLEVAIDDAGAQGFYAHLGYRTTARLRAYYMGHLDALVMQKQLNEEDNKTLS